MEFFHFATASRPAMWSAQPHIQWVQGAPSPGGVKLTIHLPVVPRLRMRGIYLHSRIRLRVVVLS